MNPARGPVSAVHSRPVALALLAVLSLVWGFHWVVVKVGLDYLPPLTYAAIRVSLGLATALAILGWQRRLRPPAREDVPIVLSVGLGQIAVGVLVQTLALQAVTAGRASLLLYTMPLWVALLLAALFRVRPRPRELLGLALGVGGLALLLNPAVIDWSAPGEVPGSLALLANAVVWGAVTVHIRRHRWVGSPLDLQPWQLLAALGPVVVAALLLEPGAPIDWQPITVLVLLYSGPLATTMGFWASQAITRSLGSQASATGFLAVPVIGLASGYLVLGEALGPADVVGFALVLAGIAAASLAPRAAPPPT